MSDLYDSCSLNWEWSNGLDSGEPVDTSSRPGPRADSISKGWKLVRDLIYMRKGRLLTWLALTLISLHLQTISFVDLPLKVEPASLSYIQFLVNARFPSLIILSIGVLVYLDTGFLQIWDSIAAASRDTPQHQSYHSKEAQFSVTNRPSTFRYRSSSCRILTFIPR